MGARSGPRALATLLRWLRRGAGRLASGERARAAEGEAVAPGAPWGPLLACLRAPELGGGAAAWGAARGVCCVGSGETFGKGVTVPAMGAGT